MAGLIHTLLRRRALKRFVRRLPGLLLADYGHRGPFTPEQVAATIGRYRVSSRAFVPYAQTIFCDRERTERAWREAGAARDYAVLRGEVGAVLFDGDHDFTLADVGREAASGGGEGQAGGHDGGHHHAGDSGHH